MDIVGFTVHLDRAVRCLRRAPGVRLMNDDEPRTWIERLCRSLQIFLRVNFLGENLAR